MDLHEIRGEIDTLDQQMVTLFCRRMALASQVAAYKKEHDMPIFVPEREIQILTKLSEQAGTEMEGYIRRLYETVFALSREYQAEVIK